MSSENNLKQLSYVIGVGLSSEQTVNVESAKSPHFLITTLIPPKIKGVNQGLPIAVQLKSMSDSFSGLSFETFSCKPQALNQKNVIVGGAFLGVTSAYDEVYNYLALLWIVDNKEKMVQSNLVALYPRNSFYHIYVEPIGEEHQGNPWKLENDHGPEANGLGMILNHRGLLVDFNNDPQHPVLVHRVAFDQASRIS